MPGATRGVLDVLKVLVVDDSRIVQQSLGRLLSVVPEIDVVGFAEDVAGAVAAIAAVRPDVVLLDVQLGGGDSGLAVLRALAGQEPAVDVVVLSNTTWESVRTRYLAAGARAYFDKSTEFEFAIAWIARRAHASGPAPA